MFVVGPIVGCDVRLKFSVCSVLKGKSISLDGPYFGILFFQLIPDKFSHWFVLYESNEVHIISHHKFHLLTVLLLCLLHAVSN